MKISTRLSGNGFSIDELVIKTKELFKKNGMPGFVELLLTLMDDMLCRNMIHGKGGACSECNSPNLKYHDRTEHTIRSSIGEIHICWRRLRCSDCKKEIIPLREFLGIKPYHRKTAELERIVSEQSFRYTSRHLELVGGVSIPFNTLHRWFMQSDCDRIKVKGKMVDVFLADGTGFKRRPDKKKGKDNKGKLKVAMGVKNDETVVPFGSWSGLSWNDARDSKTAQTNGIWLERKRRGENDADNNQAVHKCRGAGRILGGEDTDNRECKISTRGNLCKIITPTFGTIPMD